MMSFGRIVLVCFNVLLLAYSTAEATYSLVALQLDYGQCFAAYYESSHLWLAIFGMFISIIGLIAVVLDSTSLQSVYTWVLVVSALVTLLFVIILFTSFPKEGADALWKKVDESPNGNWLHEYSPILRSCVVNDKDWYQLRTCLNKTDLCSVFRNHSMDHNSDFMHDFQYPQLGCCQPPKRCGLLLKNDTYYEVPALGLAFNDDECQMWSEAKDGVCHNCDSCKAGFIAKSQERWQARGAALLCLLVLLMAATIISWFSFKDSIKSKAPKRYQIYGGQA